ESGQHRLDDHARCPLLWCNRHTYCDTIRVRQADPARQLDLDTALDVGARATDVDGRGSQYGDSFQSRPVTDDGEYDWIDADVAQPVARRWRAAHRRRDRNRTVVD